MFCILLPPKMSAFRDSIHCESTLLSFLTVVIYVCYAKKADIFQVQEFCEKCLIKNVALACVNFSCGNYNKIPSFAADF